MPILPSIAWLVVYVATVAACFHWHNRQPSRHLVMMAGGMALVAVLIVPAAFSELAGHDQLVRLADRIMEPEVSYGREIADSGHRLTTLCRRLTWIGLAFFALGFWRFAKDLAQKAAYPPPDQA